MLDPDPNKINMDLQPPYSTFQHLFHEFRKLSLRNYKI
jgi:hypothetical protein